MLESSSIQERNASTPLDPGLIQDDGVKLNGIKVFPVPSGWPCIELQVDGCGILQNGKRPSAAHCDTASCAGVQDTPHHLESMDSGLRQNDAKLRSATFCDVVNYGRWYDPCRPAEKIEIAAGARSHS